MLRKLNFTERARLGRADFRVTMRRGDDGALAFDPVLRLDAKALPSDARIYLEAYHRTSFMRFDCGTVSELEMPEDRRLTEIDSNSVRFRLKIVNAADKRIVAVADDVRVSERATERKGSTPLLPVQFSAELGQLAWHVAFEPDTPVLELNSTIDGIERLAREDSLFFALVYPAAVREILTRVLLVDEHDPFDETDEWWSLWTRWGAQQTPSPLPRHHDDRARWIDDVVSAFCALHRTVEKLGRGDE